MAAPPSSKRETDENRAFSEILADRVRAPRPNKIVCVIRCQITRTQMHTSLKRLASARHSSKSFLPVECTLQTKQSLKTKKRMTYFPGAPLYCGRAGSDVIGCRRPTGGVFVCMLQTRVTLTAFPIATPRGCSVSFPTLREPWLHM